MRIERTTQFKRDYKRKAKGPHRTTLETAFIEVLGDLIKYIDKPCKISNLFTINHQPSTINHQPSTINHQPMI